MKVRDLLRTPYTFFDASDTLEHIVSVFQQRHISSAPVVKEGEYIGIVSDRTITRRFLPKRFMGLWTIELPAPIGELRRTTAQSLVTREVPVLRPDQDVEYVLDAVVNKCVDCMPVVEGGKLIGIVRGADVMRVLQKYFAVYEEKHLERKGAEERVSMETTLDKVLRLVEAEGRISSADVAKRLGITREAVEKIGASLEKHKLIKVRNLLLGGQEFTSIERE
jgi:predicted transcriptional regulator